MDNQEFSMLFENFMQTKRNEMKVRYNRVLPSGELIFNRFDKAKYLSAGIGASIYDTSIVMGDVQIGENVWIGPYTVLEGINAILKIGDYVSINAGVTIYTHDSTKYYVSGGKDPYVKGNVSIGDNTVIGTMSMINCNVTIGSHCVIGAHSFVNQDIPDYSIAVGIPAKVVGKVYINEEGKVAFRYE